MCCVVSVFFLFFPFSFMDVCACAHTCVRDCISVRTPEHKGQHFHFPS